MFAFENSPTLRHKSINCIFNYVIDLNFDGDVRFGTYLYGPKENGFLFTSVILGFCTFI